MKNQEERPHPLSTRQHDRVCRFLLSFLPGFLLGLTLPGPVNNAQESVFETRLQQIGMKTDVNSLVDFIREFSPLASKNSMAEKWIQQLGDSDYRVRHKATMQLMKTPLPVEMRLRIAAEKSADTEVRKRSQLVLSKRTRADYLFSILNVISQKKTSGILPELFSVLPHCQKTEERESLLRAIRSCAKKEDRKLLESQLASKDPWVRIAAARAFAEIAPKSAETRLKSLLADKSDRVRVAVCRLLGRQGDRKVLPVLGGLLQSDDLLVRVSAAATLRQMSGKHFQYFGYAKLEDQAEAIRNWQRWIKEKGITSELDFDLTRKHSAGGELKGHTLMSYGNSNNKVVEFDLDGQEVWFYLAKTPRAAEKLASGNVLISELQNNRVIEVDLSGKIVWQVKLAMPLTVYPLSNGNILVAQFEKPSQTVEVNRLGEIVWRMPVEGNCCSAFPVDNGNTLIAAYGKSVQEVEPSGKVVWEYPVTQSHGSRVIPGGNILISIQPTGQVLEVNRKKEVVWECRHQGAVDAFRLKNGNTLISGYSQTVEMTPDKRIIWRAGGTQYGTARR